MLLLIIGVLITVGAVVIIAKVRFSGGVPAVPLGWMSPQWLAQYRASHAG